MDQQSFEQIVLSAEQLGQVLNYLKEGMTLQLSMHERQPLAVELPNTVELKVIKAAPAFKGNTAQGGGKPATLETGITIQVPFFIEAGDVVLVDTRSGEYVERISS
jgi:elongation factor P